MDHCTIEKLLITYRDVLICLEITEDEKEILQYIDIKYSIMKEFIKLLELPNNIDERRLINEVEAYIINFL